MNRRAINLIIVLVTLIITALLVYFIIIPGFTNIWDGIVTLNNKENTYTQEKNNIETIRANESQYQKLSKELDELYRAIPTQKEVDSFAVKIDEKAKSTGNEIKTIKIVTPTETKTLKNKEDNANNKTSSQTISQPTSKEKAPFTQVLKVGNLYAIQFEVTLTGNFSSLLSFITSVENMNRLVEIKNIDSKQTSDNAIETTISGLIYIKPE